MAERCTTVVEASRSTGSSDNLVLGNRAHENGTQQLATFDGAGFVVTGEGGHNNQLRQNEALRNHGRGFILAKPAAESSGAT